jgi:hypothetical protein
LAEEDFNISEKNLQILRELITRLNNDCLEKENEEFSKKMKKQIKRILYDNRDRVKEKIKSM